MYMGGGCLRCGDAGDDGRDDGRDDGEGFHFHFEFEICWIDGLKDWDGRGELASFFGGGGE